MNLLDTDKELRAFVNQQMSELDTLLSDETKVHVTQKNATKIIKKLNKFEDSTNMLTDKKYCISIAIKADGKNAFACYGLSDDIYEAVMIAKRKTVETLHSQIDNSISNATQLNEVEFIKQGLGIKH